MIIISDGVYYGQHWRFRVHGQGLHESAGEILQEQRVLVPSDAGQERDGEPTKGKATHNNLVAAIQYNSSVQDAYLFRLGKRCHFIYYYKLTPPTSPS